MSDAESLSSRLNWLRAAVLGANDGIISTAGLVVGVAAATSDRSDVATAGVAGLVAGAVSMALGEYVSVSTQRDAERAIIAQEIHEHRTIPDEEHDELVDILQRQGLTQPTAHQVAGEVEASNALAGHLRIEYGIHPDDLVSPWAAAGSSAVWFSVGALLPLTASVVPPADWRVPITFVAVLLGLCLTGWVSAHIGGARASRAIGRLLFGGTVAMAVTYAVGQLLSTAVT